MAYEVSVEPDQQFATEAGQALLWDVYRPLDAPRPLPVALIFHGGGWRRGDRSRMAEAATGLAGRGYLAIAVGYRLLTDEVYWPAPVHDVKTAIRAVRARYGELGANPDQIGLVGYSAGAHIALLAAATAGSASVFAGGDRQYSGQDEAVRAVAAFFPPVTKERVGSMLDLRERDAEEAAPLEYASTGVLPPVLLLHGTGDGLVPHEPHSLAMFDALRAAGAATDLRLYHDLPHEFVRLPGMTELTVADVATFLDRHVARTEEFATALDAAKAEWDARVAARAASS
jgi:acetyl esterase/lipase